MPTSQTLFHRLSLLTLFYRSERTYVTVSTLAGEKTRTTKSVVRATSCSQVNVYAKQGVPVIP